LRSGQVHAERADQGTGESKSRAAPGEPWRCLTPTQIKERRNQIQDVASIAEPVIDVHHKLPVRDMQFNRIVMRAETDVLQHRRGTASHHRLRQWVNWWRRARIESPKTLAAFGVQTRPKMRAGGHDGRQRVLQRCSTG
jgi:hypothetical protein